MGLSRTTKPQPSQRRPSSRRLFTIEHANRTLPLVRRIVADIVQQHKRVCALEEAIEESCSNPFIDSTREEKKKLRDQYNTCLEELRALMNELSAVGCELKDFRRGLVDFPSMHDGREVNLCWRLGEKKVEYWHGVDAGFRARRKIDAQFQTVDVS